MDSTSSRELANKEEKEQKPVFDEKNLSVFDSLTPSIQRHTVHLNLPKSAYARFSVKFLIHHTMSNSS